MAFEVIYPCDMKELAESGALVIDIRENEAYGKSHYKGAVNIPYDKLAQALERAPKHKTIVIYCEHGGTSIMAARRLAAQGYRVCAVAGGMRAIEKMSAGSGL
jgi:rhodanese-related sulfurtransferase